MAVNIIIDIILIGILAVGAIIGVKRGFILTIAKPVKTFAAIFTAYALSSPFATAIVQPLIQPPITNEIAKYLSKKCADISAQNANTKLPTLLKYAAGKAGVDVTALTGENSEQYIQSLVDNLASPAIHIIAVIIAFIALYFLSKLLYTFVVSVVNSTLDHGVVGTLNKVLGCVFTTFFAFVVAWGLTTVFGAVISLPAVANTKWGSEFSGGYIYQFFKSFTPIDLLLSF